MSLRINRRQKRPLEQVAGGRFGIGSPNLVRGLQVPISEQACYASLTDGRWRYWVRQSEEAETFADAIGRLVPLPAHAFMSRLNDHATGPVRPSFWKGPEGEAIVYDLADIAVIERFTLTCVFAEALTGCGVEVERDGRNTEGTLVQDALPNLNTNLALWALEAKGQVLVLFPNAALLRRDRHQWVVPYGEVAVLTDPEGDGARMRLALSDQRIVLHLSDAKAASRADKALERLIEFERRKGTHVGPKPDGPHVRRRRRGPRGRPRVSSCGTITIREKTAEEAAASKETGPAKRPAARQGTGPMKRPGARKDRGPAGRPGRVPPGSGPMRRPGTGRVQPPGTGRVARPGTGRVQRPGTGRVARPSTGRVGPGHATPPPLPPEAQTPPPLPASARRVRHTDRIVVRVQVEADPPPPEDDAGMETPPPLTEDEGDLIFCDDSGLVFSEESPLADDSGVLLIAPGASGTTVDLPEAKPKAEPPAPAPAASKPRPKPRPPTGRLGRNAAAPPLPEKDRIRAAVGALMAYIAKSSDGFSAAEQAVIRKVLQLPAGLDLHRHYAAVRTGSSVLTESLATLRDQLEDVRERVLHHCERVANADGEVTPLERQRLTELRDALGL